MSDFDQDLYDRLDAEADTHAPTSENMPKVRQRHIFTEWYAGWDACVEAAARIAAERQPVPVSDEEGEARRKAFEFAEELDALLSPINFEHESDRDYLVADILEASVRAALGPVVPVIPEGWRLSFLEFNRYETQYADYVARIERIDNEGEYEQDFALNPFDALTGAIDAAKERDHE